jgi:predicted PurR-regulated permease PerM
MKSQKPPDSVVALDDKSLVRALLWVVAFFAFVQFVFAAKTALILISVAFFFALALSPLVNYLARKIPGRNRVVATGGAYLITILLVGSLVYSITPVAIKQLQSFISAIPGFLENLEADQGVIAEFIRQYEIIERAEDVQRQISGNIGNLGEPLVRTLQTILTSLAAMITVLVLTFFMLVEGPLWLERFWRLQPKSKLKKRQKLAFDMYRAVTGYVNGQFIIAFISGVVTFILLSILAMPYPLALAAIIAVTGLIPLIGNTLGAVIVIVVGLFQSFGVAVFLTIFYIVYQQLENNIIQPAVQSQTVSLSPLSILIAALIGISVAGFLGALVAIPVAGSIRVLVLYLIDKYSLMNRV